MVSKNQLVANKQNAKKGGVKTASGKAVARLNALRYGLLSEEILLTGEIEEALTGLAERLVADHQAGAEEAARLARLSRGCLGWAIGALEDPQVLEQREAELDRLREACEAGLSLRFGYATELATLFSKDREATIQLLYLWLRWWRDLMLIKEGVQEFVTNEDQLSELSLQATQLTTGRIVQVIKSLIHTIDALDHNANPRLTLEALMVGLPRMKAQI